MISASSKFEFNTKPLEPIKYDRRSRHYKEPGRDIAPYNTEPKEFTKLPFAGADPYENEEW